MAAIMATPAQLPDPRAPAVESPNALVAATEMFTPADIEFAARKGAQLGFEREIEFRRGEPRPAPRIT